MEVEVKVDISGTYRSSALLYQRQIHVDAIHAFVLGWASWLGRSFPPLELWKITKFQRWDGQLAVVEMAGCCLATMTSCRQMSSISLDCFSRVLSSPV